MPDNTRRARDELFWRTFADRYALEPGPINLENGYFGRMSRTVVEEYQRNIELINRSNSVHVRQRFEQGQNQAIVAQLAEHVTQLPVRAKQAVFGDRRAAHPPRPAPGAADRLAIVGMQARQPGQTGV